MLFVQHLTGCVTMVSVTTTVFVSWFSLEMISDAHIRGVIYRQNYRIK